MKLTLSLCLFAAIVLGACTPASNNATVNPPAPAPAPRKLDDAAARARAAELQKQATEEMRNGGTVKAAELLAEAVELAPGNPALHEQFAAACQKLRRFSEAREHFLLAARHATPDERPRLRNLAAECSHSMAVEAYRIKEDKLALEHIRDSLVLRPGHGEAAMLQGWVEFRMKDYAAALASFQLASDVLSGVKRHEAMCWLGQTHYWLKEYATAEATLTTIINEGYTELDVHGWRGYARQQLGNFTGARQDFLQAAQATRDEAKRKEFHEAASKAEAAGG